MTIDALATQWRTTAKTLRIYGASAQADTLDACADELARTLADAPPGEEETVSVSEAARRSGTVPETVRRAVRSGELPDLRRNKRGAMRIRVSDIPYLSGKARAKPQTPAGEYDPVAHLRRFM